MDYVKGASILLLPIILMFVSIYLPIRIGHLTGRTLSARAGTLVVVGSNIIFLILDLWLLRGLFGGQFSFPELWIFVFLPTSLIVGLMTVRLINHDQRGF